MIGSVSGGEIGNAVLKAAASFDGVPFRLHGRDPATGLDCVGLVIASLGKAGQKTVSPAGYRLKQSSVARFLPSAAANGLVEATGNLMAGDVVIFAVGPLQHHLAISDGDGRFWQAHAGLGKTVCCRAEPGWIIEKHWRPYAR